MTGVGQVAVPAVVTSAAESPVTVSLNVKLKTTVRDVEDVDEVDHEAEGSDASIVTDVAAVVVAGPLLPAPSITAEERIERPAVPVLVQARSIRYVDPEIVTGEIVHGLALPVAVKSAAARPVTLSEKVREYDRLVLPVGEVGEVRVAVGDVMSIVTVLLEAAELGPTLPLASVTVDGSRDTETVPSLAQST